jgi:L-asparagine transporter-like permease
MRRSLLLPSPRSERQPVLSSSLLDWCVNTTLRSLAKHTYLLTSQVGINALRHVINGAVLVFVLSAANSDLYIGSRTLYALAVEGKAPAVFRKVNRMGVPWPALLLCTAFCFLVYLNVASSGAKGTYFVVERVILRVID